MLHTVYLITSIMWLHGSDFMIKTLTTIACSSLKLQIYNCYSIPLNIIKTKYQHKSCYSHPEKKYHYNMLSFSTEYGINRIENMQTLSTIECAYLGLQSNTLSKLQPAFYIFHY